MKLNYLMGAAVVLALATSCNKCKDIDCNSKGTCDKGECSCDAGWSGSNCETEDKCITNNVSCQNGGLCTDGICDCEAYYYGNSCEDYCVNGSYEEGNCECDLGYEGGTCETMSRTKFIGTYYTTNCSTEPNQVAHIAAHETMTEAQYISIERLAYDDDTDGYAVVHGNQIWVPQQTVHGNSTWTVKSLDTGTFENNQFSIMVNRKSGSFSLDCELTYVKQ